MRRSIAFALAAGLLIVSAVASAPASPKLGFFNIWGRALNPRGSNDSDWGAPVPMQGLAIKYSGAQLGWTNKYDDVVIDAIQQGGLCELIPYVYTNNKEDAKHLYDVHGVRRFCFGNEPELMPEGLDGYMYNLSGGSSGQGAYWVCHNYLGPDALLIAGNCQSPYVYDYLYTWDPSFAGLNDIVGFHPYSDDPATGLSIGSVSYVHGRMVRYDDGSKQMFLGEGWGPKRELSYCKRGSQYVPPSPTEIEGLREFVINGYKNLTTPTADYDPNWIYGALFFTLSDNWGYEGGSIWRYFNGGLIDLNGNPKDDLLLLFPGNRLTIANCGFEHYDLGNPFEVAPFWQIRSGTSPSCYAIDASIRHGGTRSQRIELSGTTEAYAHQTTPPGTIVGGQQYTFAAWAKTEDVVQSSYRGVKIRMRFYDAGGSTVGSDAWSDGIQGTNDWTLLTVTATAPSSAVNVRLDCNLNAAGGRAWFDDLGITAGASPHTGAIEGYVLDRNRNGAIAGATVVCKPGSHTTTSDATGWFTFSNLPAGTYDLVASKDLYSIEAIRRVVVAPDRTSICGLHLVARLVTSPPNVQITNPQMGRMLKLSWEPPPGGADSYRVWRNTDSHYWGPVIFDHLNATEVWDTTLNDNTTYYYHVAGWRNGELLDTTGADYEGFSTASATSTTPPDITDISAASSGQGSVEITWKTTAPTTSQVQYGPTTSYGSWSLDANLVDAHTVTLAGLPVGTCHFRVKGTRSGRSDAYSLDYTFRVPQHYQSLAAVKALPDGSYVGSAAIVTAIFADRFYVADQYRLSGMRVEATPAGIVEGQTVYVSGALMTDPSGERCILP